MRVLLLLCLLLAATPTPAPYPAPATVVYEAKAGAPPPCGSPSAPYWLIRFGSDPAEYLPCDDVVPTLGPAPTPLPERAYAVRMWLGVVLRGAVVP